MIYKEIAQSIENMSPPFQPFVNIFTRDYTEIVMRDWNEKSVKKSAVFYQFKAAQTLNCCNIPIVPDACVNMLIELDPAEPRTFCSGVFLEPKMLNLKPGVEYFGCKPYSALGLRMGGCTVSDILDTSLPLTEVFPGMAQLVEHMLCATTRFEQRVKLMYDFAWDNMIDRQYVPSFIDYMAAIVCSSNPDCLSVNLERATGYSDRYCRKRFNKAFGCSPKQYSSIMRLQNTLKSLQWWHADSLSALAIQQGYYDQAHFIHDFKKYMSMTPNSFKKLLDSVLWESTA
ncbi:MAG: helix-turn-helix domain-containing protein [Clostridiales Family XIII bacterium]|nr:helix-turn-helix domain-containing protein [Clostridiales Family XIII bacterium]